MNLRLAAVEDLAALAHLIAVKCAIPETHCIHSSASESESAIAEEIARLHASGEIMFALAIEDDRIRATAGCEFDVELDRGWLRGPFSDPLDWSLAGQTYDFLRAQLPEELKRLDSFLNVKNKDDHAFYLARGFEEASSAHVYTAPRGTNGSAPEAQGPTVGQLPAGLTQSLANLHDQIFPGTYYTGKMLIEKQDRDHRLFVVADDAQVLGYLFGIVEPESEEGYVDFLGVRESARREGIAGALLRQALRWFFWDKDMPAVGLTVDDQNVNARGLYERVGFELTYSGANARWTNKT